MTTELIFQWRQEALNAKDVRPTYAMALNRCARELERAIHDDKHDAEWRDGCPHCEKERKPRVPLKVSQ